MIFRINNKHDSGFTIKLSFVLKLFEIKQFLSHLFVNINTNKHVNVLTNVKFIYINQKEER